jgi:hypothetical protein
MNQHANNMHSDLFHPIDEAMTFGETPKTSERPDPLASFNTSPLLKGHNANFESTSPFHYDGDKDGYPDFNLGTNPVTFNTAPVPVTHQALSILPTPRILPPYLLLPPTKPILPMPRILPPYLLLPTTKPILPTPRILPSPSFRPSYCHSTSYYFCPLSDSFYQRPEFCNLSSPSCHSSSSSCIRQSCTCTCH